MDSSPQKPSSPGLGPSESSPERREAPSLPSSDSSSPSLVELEPSPAPPSVPLTRSSCSPSAAGEHEEVLQAASTVPAVLAQTSYPDTESLLPEVSPSPSASPSPPLKAVNGLAESPAPSPCCETELSSQEILSDSLPNTQFSAMSPVLQEEPQKEAPALREHLQSESPSPPFSHGTQTSATSVTSSITTTDLPAAQLQSASIEINEISQTSDTNNVHLKAEAAVQEADGHSDAQSQDNSRNMIATGTVHVVFLVSDKV